MPGLIRAALVSALALACAALPSAASADACANGSASSATRPVAFTTPGFATIQQVDVSRQRAVGRSSGTTSSAAAAPSTFIVGGEAGALRGSSEAVVTAAADSATATTLIAGVDLRAFVPTPSPLVPAVLLNVSSTATVSTSTALAAAPTAEVSASGTVSGQRFELTVDQPLLVVPGFGEILLGPTTTQEEDPAKQTPEEAVAAGVLVTLSDGTRFVLGEARAAVSSSGCQGATRTT